MPLIMFVSSSFNTYVNLPKKKGLSNVSAVLQTKKAKAGIETFQYGSLLNISDRVKDAKNEMDKAQQALHTAHENLILCMRERDAVHKYASTVRAEESFFKQKAKIQWLSLGDQNTSYFHKSVNGRQNRNKLLSLTRK